MKLFDRILTAAKILAGYHLQDWTSARTAYVQQSNNARIDIPYGVRRQMLSWAREMERKDPIFNSFLDLCERYVIGPTGLRIVSGSEDAVWAALANAEWDNSQPWLDISSRFSFGQRQGLIEREVEVAGEVFIYLTYGSTNRPRIQLIESESVETPPDLSNDKTVFDGVKTDESGRPLAYYVKSLSGDFKAIDADSMIHVFEPSRVGQVRGLSIVYPVLDHMIDLRQSIDLEMLSHKSGAEIANIVTNAAGEMTADKFRRSQVSASTARPSTGEAHTVSRETQLKDAIGGRTIILKNGESFNQFANQRPGDAVRNFWDFVSAREAAGLGLPIEIMIMRSLQGTMTRAALDMANAFFRCRAAARAESFARVFQHVVNGSPALRRAMPQDWRKIRYTPPRSINVDVGRNSSALIAEWQAGFRTLEDIAGELGKDWQEILRQRAIEFAKAREIEIQFGLPPGSILEVKTPPQPQPEPTATNRLAFNSLQP